MIKKAIEAFLSRNSLRDSQVVVAVPGQQTLTRFTKMPPVEAKKIPDMVQYEASQQIPFDMDEVVWDYQVLTEKDSPDVEVGIFAIRKELIRNYLLQFTDAGISPFIVQSSPMASYNAARFEQPAEAGKACVLLDMGALATDLIVMEGNRIWSRPIPIGGNRFTESLVSAFKISFGKAERLKRTAAASKHARQIFQAMRPVLQDLVNEIQRSIGYYTSTHRDAHIVRAMGMGNAFKLPGLQKFLQQNLQIEVEKLGTFKKMAVPADKSQAFGENILSFPVAYGLAIQGLGLAAVGSNLIPLETRRSLLWAKKKPWFAASAASIALAAGAMWVGNVMASSQAKSALSSPEPVPVASIEAAEQIINGGAASASPLERAAKVAGAAERLKQELGKVSSQPMGDMGSVTAMNNLLANNVYIPRILDTVYKVFGQAAPEDLRTIEDPRAYVAEAGKKAAEAQQQGKNPREARQEVWLQQIEMRWEPVNASVLMPGREGSPQDNPEDSKSPKSGPGWVLIILGETTVPADEAPVWVRDKIVEELKRLGCQPDRGFYFEEVRTSEFRERTKGAELEVPTERTGERESGRGGGTSTGATGGSTGRRGGRMAAGAAGGGGTQSGQTPARSGRGMPDDSGRPSRTAEPGVESGSKELLDAIRKQAEENDPLLTEESASKDRQFKIYVLVRKAASVPKELLPEEFKKAADGKAEDKKAAPAEPAEPARRED
jgi:type IV pilus assembly protein PilM